VTWTDYLSDWAGAHLVLISASLLIWIALWRVIKRFRQTRAAKAILDEAIRTQTHEPITLHPEIDPALCAGCGACTNVCPEGDILQIIDHKAVLVGPTKCVGHGECERACPTDAITLVFGTKTRGMDIPRISTDYETNVPGLYIAGELGGMGLIRNAIKQGYLGASHALQDIQNVAHPTDTDLLVVGAGPAGIAAGLTAIVQKKPYICIEQEKFGGTIYNFPKQKVVMTYPADLPGYGKMKFSKNEVSKEALLAYWKGICTKTGFKIRENVRFISMKKEEDIFKVQTSQGEIKAKKVILCMGVRGTPRKLGLPNEELPKVTYGLLDPEQYREKNLALVGAGNVAVEAALAVSDPALHNKVTLIVRSPVLDRCNEKNKAGILSVEAKGGIKILYDCAVAEIHADRIMVGDLNGAQLQTINNDFLFVMIGAEMPHRFLMSLGIQIDKKFGETLGASNA
jgi:thioredoxin reductase (NADPH)